MQFKGTLGQSLIGVADGARDLFTQFGLRPYVVRMIRTRWTGDPRGDGNEYVEHIRDLLPTPKLVDMSSLSEVVLAIGTDETGSVMLTEISGRYTEDELRGLDPDGTPVESNSQVYFEIEFPKPSGGLSEHRRFTLAGAPSYMADKFQWQIRLERQRPARDRQGYPR